LTLQDAQTALATLDPAKAFGGSAFGPLQFRVVTDNGVKGDWQPLATLVRLPRFQSLQCSEDASEACTLKGSDLFLVDAIAQNQQFVNPVQVPDGFPGRVLPVPHPQGGGELYVKLRDDPSAVNVVTLTPEITKAAKQQAAAKEPEKFRPKYVSPENTNAAPAAGAGSAGSAAQPNAAPTSSAPPASSPAAPAAAPSTAAPKTTTPAPASQNSSPNPPN
jgi:hypothetical protein